LPRLIFRGNYVCDLTDDAKLALNELDHTVYYYYNGVTRIY
jgi:hypothetical protein